MTNEEKAKLVLGTFSEAQRYVINEYSRYLPPLERKYKPVYKPVIITETEEQILSKYESKHKKRRNKRC